MILSHMSTIVTTFLGCLVVILAALWTLEKVFDKLLVVFKVKAIFCEYIWHQKEFKRWLAANCTDLTPAAPDCGASSEADAARKD